MKNIKVLSSLIALLFVTLISCDNEDDYVVSPDKLTRLMITQSNFMVIESTPEYEVYLGYLTDFSISDYRSVAEAKLVVMGACNHTSDQVFEIKLYDMTNKQPIEDSEVLLQSGECNVNGESKDIKGNFPNGRVDIGIMVKAPGSGAFWGSYLYLYRK